MLLSDRFEVRGDPTRNAFMGDPIAVVILVEWKLDENTPHTQNELVTSATLVVTGALLVVTRS